MGVQKFCGDVAAAEQGNLSSPTSFFVLWMMVAAFLDVIDGPLARMLGQTSQLGVYVDIVADNIWRTVSWVAAVVTTPQSAGIGVLAIALEWLTFFASQVSSLEQAKSHEKTSGALEVAFRTQRWVFPS